MDLVEIYRCLADLTRLRIVNLLSSGPLCVCHIQSILGEPQVKVSKHLAILKEGGLVEARREANWMIYSLPAVRTVTLEANIGCIRHNPSPVLAQDNAGLKKLLAAMPEKSPACTLATPSGKAPRVTPAKKSR